MNNVIAIINGFGMCHYTLFTPNGTEVVKAHFMDSYSVEFFALELIELSRVEPIEWVVVGDSILIWEKQG